MDHYPFHDRRQEDPWRRQIERELHDLTERLEKNNMLLLDMLEVWDTLKGGVRAIQFLTKALKIIVGFVAAVAAAYTMWSQYTGGL